MEIDLRFSIKDFPGARITQSIDVSERIIASQLCRILNVEEVSLYDEGYVRDIKGYEKLKDILEKYSKLEPPQFDVMTIDIERANKIFPDLLKGYLTLRGRK